MEFKKIIVFDGYCNFCNFWVNFLIDRDANDIFRFVSLQSDPGQNLLRKFNLTTDNFDTFVLIDSLKFYTRSTAAFTIANLLPFPYFLISYFRFLPIFVTDAVYNIFAKNRYRFFGKRESCRVPSPDLRKKFLT